MSNENEAKYSAALLTEEKFRELYQYEEPQQTPFKNKLANNFKCTKNTIFNFFPILGWLTHYKIKTDLLSDIIAGITVAIMHIPHGLAYAPLGGVEPVVGFYMAIFPVIIYVFMGTSRHISLGTFAVQCAMVGQVIMKHEADKYYENEVDTALVINSSSLFTNDHIEIGTAITLMVGLWQVILAVFRMGAFTVIMSESLISGFTTGAAFHVLSLQLKNLFGVNVLKFSGALKLFYIYIDFLKKITTVNFVTMGLSISCISILFFFTLFLNPLIQMKFPKNKFPIPIELIVVILGILLSYFLNLRDNFDVKVVDDIPSGFPIPSIPPYKILPYLIFDSFSIAIVAIAISVSLAKIFAKKGNYTVSNNQELLAYGAGNIFAAFFKCLPAAASLSRSSVQYVTGGKTQLASLFSLIIVLIIILFAGFLFEPVPYCVLSSIVIVSLKGLLVQVADFPKIWRENRLNGIVWLGTFLGVIILDLDYGLIVGVVLSIFSVIYSSKKVDVAVTGNVPGSDIYLDVEQYKAAETLPKILILQITGQLNFINCSTFESLVITKFNKFSQSLKGDGATFVVLYMSGVIQVDPSSVNTIRSLYKYLIKQNSDLYLTNCNVEVYKAFNRCKLFTDLPKEQVISSLPNAVDYLKRYS